MMHQAIKTTAVMLSFLLLAAGPAQAGPIAYGDVVSLATVFGSQGERTSVDLRLRALSQQQGKPAAQQLPPATAPDGKTSPNGPASGDTSGGGTSGANVSLTGTEIAPQQTQTTVETIQVGEVDGTICDCGPILTPGGFPLWPLLGLAGIPLFFISGDDEIPPVDVLPTPTPTPTPPTAVPEPAPLRLLGTGLRAAAGGARRRRRLSKLVEEEVV
jgi:hypothetical protein